VPSPDTQADPHRHPIAKDQLQAIHGVVVGDRAQAIHRSAGVFSDTSGLVGRRESVAATGLEERLTLATRLET
jgi:hypothetical protein